MLYDADRSRLRGTLEHLGALGQLVAGQSPDPQLAGHLLDLRTGGAVVGGEVTPDLRELVTVVSRPNFVIELETSSPAGPVHHSVSLRERSAWVMEGWGGTDEVTWWPCEPALLVPTIASLVGLRRRDVPAGTERRQIRAPLGLVDRALEALALGGREHHDTALAAVRASLGAAALAPPAADALMALLSAHRAAWRATFAEPDDEGMRVRGMVVIDAGAYGLWRRTAPAEPIAREDVREHTELLLDPTTPGAVWKDLVALLGVEQDGAAAA